MLKNNTGLLKKTYIIYHFFIFWVYIYKCFANTNLEKCETRAPFWDKQVVTKRAPNEIWWTFNTVLARFALPKNAQRYASRLTQNVIWLTQNVYIDIFDSHWKWISNIILEKKCYAIKQFVSFFLKLMICAETYAPYIKPEEKSKQFKKKKVFITFAIFFLLMEIQHCIRKNIVGNPCA